MAVQILVALVLLSLVASSAFFSAIETAIFSLQPFQLRRLREKNRHLAGALDRAMENPRGTLSAILFADAASNIPLIVLCVFLLGEATPSLVPFWIEALVIFALIAFFCDLVPKLVALVRPYRIALAGIAVLRVIDPIAGPFWRILENTTEKVVDVFTPARFQARHILNDDEVETMVQLSAEEGALHASESEMIQEIIKLADKTAKDCMTPRTEMFALSDDLENAEALDLLRTKRHRRVPVYGSTPDEILGILDVLAFLTNPRAHYTELMTPPSFVSETMNALDLLRSFFTHKQGMAVIVDEFGGTEGIITSSDITEEILSDAVPSAERDLYIEPMGDGKLLVSGAARLDDLSEHLGMELEEEGVETIGGLVFNHLGFLPRAGTQLELSGLELTVRRASRKRIAELVISRPEAVAKT